MKYVYITREFIDTGCQGDTEECPVGLALKEAGFKSVFVGLKSMSLDMKKNRKDDPSLWTYNYRLPYSVSKFIDIYDRVITDEETTELKPFYFDLDTCEVIDEDEVAKTKLGTPHHTFVL